MKIRHSGGSLCEVSDEYGAALLASSPDWVVEVAPKHRAPRKTAAPKAAPEVKPIGAALAGEE